MEAVLQDFDSRYKEVVGYLRMLTAIERHGARIANARGGKAISVEDEWRRVSKASAYLMLYNVVESSIRSAFTHLHTVMEQDGCTLSESSEAVQHLWVRLRHSRLTRETAAPSNYYEVAREMVVSALANEVVRLNRERLPISGNLDAEAVRQLCHDHGVPVTTPKRARGGVALDTVKEQRNALAHGNRSFSESGRDVTVSDLRRVALEVKAFLHGVLRNVDKYIGRRSYRASVAVPATSRRRPTSRATKGR